MRNRIKAVIMYGVIPLLFKIFCLAPVQKKRILFADTHHDEIPFSMRRLRDKVKAEGAFEVIEFYQNIASSVSGQLKFLRLYARAKIVIVCDYCAPVSAVKRKGQFIIQLWHSGGLLKKMGYDAAEDIAPGWRGDMFKNYDMVTVSAPVVSPVLAKGMRLPFEKVQPIGVCRTDYYSDQQWLEECRTKFQLCYPEARDKTVVLYAPTFRGNAAAPYLTGIDEILQAQHALQDTHYFILSLHPHLVKHYPQYAAKMPSEELLPMADMLITDYSSILFDYLLFDKPIVLFAPDLEEYQAARGFYVEYETLPGAIAQNTDELVREIAHPKTVNLSEWRSVHMLSCDGAVTERIYRELQAYV